MRGTPSTLASPPGGFRIIKGRICSVQILPLQQLSEELPQICSLWMLQKSQDAENMLLCVKYMQDTTSGEQQQKTDGSETGRQRRCALRKSFYSHQNVWLEALRNFHVYSLSSCSESCCSGISPCWVTNFGQDLFDPIRDRPECLRTRFVDWLQQNLTSDREEQTLIISFH